MNKRIIIAALSLFFCWSSVEAQEVVTVEGEKGGKQNIEVPENMLTDVDSLLMDWNARNYLKKEECDSKVDNPEFSSDVYIDRLQRMPTVVEMPYNSVVRKFIDMYGTRLRNSVSFMLGAVNFYMPIFEEALDMYGLPQELKYLPVIESALRPTAVSRAGAVGLWQLMLKTGKQYDLEINSLVDERRDPIKASRAAARYLKDLYGIFGDWNLVIASYNCGPGNVNKAMHRSDGNRDYWEIYNYLPNETRGYVPAFIAANYMMTYYCDHHICPMDTEIPASTDTIMVSKDVHLQQIADVCKISMDQLRSLNPQYKKDIIPGSIKPYTLRLPSDKIGTFIDMQDSIYNYQKDQFFTKRKVIEMDETQWKSSNNRNSYSRSSARRGRSGRSRRGGRGATHTIKGGETLGEIAEKYGVSVKKLKRLNNIKGSMINKGKKLRVR